MTPINGAVSSQIRAQTTHENTQILCLSGDTNSPVVVTRKVCEQVVADLATIAVTMTNATDTGSGTIYYRCYIFG